MPSASAPPPPHADAQRVEASAGTATTTTTATQVSDPAPARATGWRRMGGALTYRDFRLVWTGAFISTIGTWMQKVAQSWLVLTLAGASSAFYLGLDSFLGEAPILLLTLIGGVVADRFDRRHVLMVSQVVQMSTALTLAALVFADVVQIWHVLTLSVITGVAQAFGGPAHHSLMPSLVPKEHLPNAIAFNAIQFNLARVIGPLIAGMALTAVGMAACFGLNGLSFVAVLIGLVMLGARPPVAGATKSMKEELRGGFAYVRQDPSLVGLATLGFMGTFLASPLLTFLPAFVQNVLHGEVTLYTRLMSFAGAGAVMGALGVAWLGKFKHMGRAVLSLQIAMGVVIVLFANTRAPMVNAALLFTGGACMVMVFAMLQSLVQLSAPNELRGRVMSLYMMAFRGGMPLGSLVGGWLTNQFSAPPVLTANGVVLAVVAAWFLVRGHSVREL